MASDVKDLEISLEVQACSEAIQAGWLALPKAKYEGRRGFVDRIFCCPGRTVWIEFKKPGGGKRALLQKREIAKLKAAGQEAHFIDDIHAFRRVMGLPGG